MRWTNYCECNVGLGVIVLLYFIEQCPLLRNLIITNSSIENTNLIKFKIIEFLWTIFYALRKLKITNLSFEIKTKLK